MQSPQQQPASQHFDVIVIGGGSGGYAAARTARESHDAVAIVDAAPELGGLCILRGCMPSKTLIYAAEVLHLARSGQRFGLNIPAAVVDMPALHAHKVAMIDDFKAYRQAQLQSERFTLFRQAAHFTAPNAIELNPSGQTLSADKFIIATGSVVNRPPIQGLDLDGIWTSDDVLDLDFLPPSVIVLGGGIVACELAQFLARAGTRVTQIQRSPAILREIAPEAAAVVAKAFRDEGITLFTDTQLHAIERRPTGFHVAFSHKGQRTSAEAAFLFNALGRRPNTDALNLAAANVTLAPSGHIAVNAFQQSSNPNVYAVGDVSGPFEIVHLAILQGETAARHATGRHSTPVNYAHRTGVVFTDPQVATAGLPIREAKALCPNLICADYPFDDHGKSLLMHATYGYVKAWADPTSGRILGAECVGKDAGELIHPLAVAIALNATTTQLLNVHWYHPTLSEIWSYPIEDLHDLRTTAP